MSQAMIAECKSNASIVLDIGLEQVSIAFTPWAGSLSKCSDFSYTVHVQFSLKQKQAISKLWLALPVVWASQHFRCVSDAY